MKKYFWETPDYWWMCLVFIPGLIGGIFNINGGIHGSGWWFFYCAASFFYCLPALGMVLAVVIFNFIVWLIKYIFSMCGKMKVSIKKQKK